jgi:hypothetical protein
LLDEEILIVFFGLWGLGILGWLQYLDPAGNVAGLRLASVSRNLAKNFCVQNSTPYIEGKYWISL